MIGKFGITGAFAVVCLYTPEVVPTTIRSVSLTCTLLTTRALYQPTDGILRSATRTGEVTVLTTLCPSLKSQVLYNCTQL